MGELSEKFRGLLTRNALANFVYVLYATLILVINYEFTPKAQAAFRTGPVDASGTRLPDFSDDYYYTQTSGPYLEALGRANVVYIAAASVHLFNALQYYLVWPGLPVPGASPARTYSLFSYVQVPEYLNIIGATLYMYTAVNYDRQQATGPGRYLDITTLQTHCIETAAAVVELCAALGWIFVWWRTHERGAGRGLTLDDPELWALALLLAASILYVAYNALLLVSPINYYALPLADDLYTSADIIYCAGAVFYGICSFRDAGFMGSFGVLVRCCGSRARPLTSSKADFELTAPAPQENPALAAAAAAAAAASEAAAALAAATPAPPAPTSASAPAAGSGVWKTLHKASGSVRYVNTVTGEKRLDMPPDFVSASQWVQCGDESGEVWYENVLTGESQWDPPPGFVAPPQPAAAAASAAAASAAAASAAAASAAAAAALASSAAATAAPAPKVTWERLLDAESKTPYYESSAGDSQWERPADFVCLWEKHYDQGDAYYVHSVTEVTQWEVPEGYESP